MNKEKTLQKLKRVELLELLLAQSKENEELRTQLEEKEKTIASLEEKLKSQKIDLNEAGTIAEASFKVNRVFQSAEKAAQQYLDNLKVLHEKEEYLCSQKESEVNAKCSKMLEETHKRCEDMREDILKKCKDMESSVKKHCEELWEQTETKCKEREKEAEERCQFLEQKAEENVERRWNDLVKRIDVYYSERNV